MLPTDPVTYKTPDGVERRLRFTLGARKRIAIALPGCAADVQEAIRQYGDGALPEIAYACMYDEDGDPPEGLTAARLAESLDGEDTIGLMAAVLSAAAKGKTPKNEIEAMLRKEMLRKARGRSRTGTSSGASPASASESQLPNAGPSPNGNSTPSGSDTENASGSSTTAQA